MSDRSTALGKAAVWLPWMALLLEAVVTLLLSPADDDGVVSILVIGLNAVVAVAAICIWSDDREITLALMLGLSFRLFLLFWDLKMSSVFLLPNSGSDTETFANWAASAAKGGGSGRGGRYSQFIAFFYLFFGVQRPIAQYLNVLMWLSATFVTDLALDELGVSKEARTLATKLLCFLPNLAVLNVILLRETTIMFLLTVAVYFFICWMREVGTRNVLMSVVFVGLASSLHSGAVAVLLGEVVVGILLDRETGRLQLQLDIVPRVIFALILFVAVNQLFGDSIFSRFQGVSSADDVAGAIDNKDAGGSAYSVGFNIGGLPGLIINSPIRMFFFVMSPVPWRWRGLSDIVAFCFSSLFYAVSLYRGYKLLKKPGESWARDAVALMLIMALASVFVFAWGVSNAGTALRHREKFTSIYVMLYALCADYELRKASEGRPALTNSSMARSRSLRRGYTARAV